MSKNLSTFLRTGNNAAPLPVSVGGTGVTTLTGLVKGTGAVALSAAVAGTDYLAPPTGTSLLKANSGGALANAVAGTDYQAPIGTISGLVKGNGANALTAAVAGTDYQAPIGTISGLVKGNGANLLTAAVAGTDYQSAQNVTGIVKSSGTTRSAAVAGTDYLAPSGALGTPSSGTLGACTIDGTNLVGYLSVPQNSQSVNYTLVASDASKHLLHPAADTTARTFTIPANSSVAYPIGTTIVFVNQNGAGVLTVAITSDTMRLAGAGTTGTRSIAANGVATAIKIASTEWIISGTNLT
jgi:hypothetical protein